MITLILLNPLKSVSVQSWTFEDESVIRIGRATENQVVLHSSVVSRYHAELRENGDSWEIVNLGANGTYLNDKEIFQAPVADGIIIRLAQSGPQLQIWLGAVCLREETKRDGAIG